MAPAFLLRREERVEAALHLREGLEVGAEGEDIGVVVAPRVLRRVLAPGHGAARVRDFVGRDRNAHPAAADHDPEGARGSHDGPGHGVRAGRVVRALGAVAAVVAAVMALRFQVFDDGLLELESAMVAAAVNLHALLQSDASHSRLARNTITVLRIKSLYPRSVSG